LLLLSGYHASSHRFWSDQLTTGLPEFDWTLVALADRHFYWRIRSNALTFALEHRDALQQNYDLIIATSMVDLCNLRGLLPTLSSVPAILYFHENQFAYPERQVDTDTQHARRNSNLINAQLTSIYSAMSAQCLVFNSRFNHDTFFTGVAELAAKMPDGIPKGFARESFEKSAVIPVPVNGADALHRTITQDNPVEIVWNHRWEYDKQPQIFFSALEKLISRGIDIKVHVMGQSFRQVPDCFGDFQNRFADHLLTWGYQPEDKYRQILRQAHIVVSSALHDFQGLGMLEAIMAGCTPVAPDRMAYPEYMPSALLYDTPDDQPESSREQYEANALFNKICSVIDLSLAQPADGVPAINADSYRTENVLPAYKSCFSDLIAGLPDT